MTRRARAVVLAGVALVAIVQLTNARRLVVDEVVPAELVEQAVRSAGAEVAAAVEAEQPEVADTPPVRVEFSAWLAGVRTEALGRGFRPEIVSAALDELEPAAVVIQQDRSQAETVLSIDRYLQRRLTPQFIRTGRQQATRHRTLLQQVSEFYDVQPRFPLAIWGIESNFGRNMGSRPVIQALATLAWDGRRGAFFRGELFNALEIADRGYITLDRMLGSWAGAMGQPQFMPSSYLKWAQDFDGDGYRDIWRSQADVFASIAFYLKSHGWSGAHTWGREVRLPEGGAPPLVARAGLREAGCRAERQMTNRLLLARWQELGVRTAAGGALPRVAIDASLVPVAGRRAYLVYQNYEAILKYNCAHTYALSVALAADRMGP